MVAWRFAAAACAGLVIAGCAGIAQKPAEQAVRERAQARWDALVKGNVEDAYAFLSPGTRAVLKRESYVASIRRGFWKAASVDQVTCEEADKCRVQVIIEYEFQRMRTKTPVRETWIREGSDWWYVQK